jgi:hypothetical protein
MKKIFIIAVIISLVFTACGGGKTPDNPKPPTEAPGTGVGDEVDPNPRPEPIK